MTTDRNRLHLVMLTLATYWGCIVFGLTGPWIAYVLVETVKHGQSFNLTLHQLRLYLFAPGYNLFLIAVLNAVPFVLFSVFSLFHLGLAPAGHCLVVRRRAAGILIAAAIGIGLSGWTHLSTLLYPDAQGALAYIFLPFLLLIAFPVSYAAGRLLGMWCIR
jgi:hypothetical protein